ncbi:hypothetical protein M9H77_36059 [Catharanthus roseus]|uniref:Uncharacterized protein n=1 Tax=Catharanthus roseus TaxID=4058 RepID=A0ACB9ZSH9_CATRO|nr:hypothetical protein M9H77_36059 [Catharanthus roseus]
MGLSYKYFFSILYLVSFDLIIPIACRRVRRVDTSRGRSVQNHLNKTSSQGGPTGFKTKEDAENSTNSFNYMSGPMRSFGAKRMQEVLSHFIHKAHAKEGIKIQDYKPMLVNSLVVMDQGLHTLN